MSGIKERIGFDTEGRGFLLTKSVKYDKIKHESECFLDVLRAEGVEIINDNFYCPLDKTSENRINTIILDNNLDNYAIVHATATNFGKLWDINNFAQIVEYLINEKNMQVVFLGAKSDYEIYEKLLTLVKKPLQSTPFNFCGKFNLKESLAMIAKAKFLVGNDSGNLHMASAVHTPVIGLYGPMPFEKWKALGKNNILLKANLPCMPCGLPKKLKCNHECLKSISVDMVKSAIDEITKKYNN